MVADDNSVGDEAMSEIKQCPFCGCDVALHQGHGDITYFLCEDGCKAIVSFRPNLKGTAAIQRWNDRSVEAVAVNSATV